MSAPGAPDYREYIQSDAWKARRVEALNRAIKDSRGIAAPQCEICGRWGTNHKNPPEPGEGRFGVWASNGLEVHHVHYRNLGQEEPEDLIVLCWPCHKRTHDDREFKREVQRLAGERWG